MTRGSTSNMDSVYEKSGDEKSGDEVSCHHQTRKSAISSSVRDTKDNNVSPANHGQKRSAVSVISDGPSMVPKKAMRASTKSDDKPKRGLSAYNLFFLMERERLVAGDPVREYDAADLERIVILAHQNAQTKRKHRKSHGKISFVELARTIANAWKKLAANEKVVIEKYAAIDKARYHRELERWIVKGKKKCPQAGDSRAKLLVKPADLRPSVEMTRATAPVHGMLPTHATSALATFPSTSPVAYKVNYPYQPTSFEANLIQISFLMQNPTKAYVLNEQIQALELEYTRQALMLQSQTAAALSASYNDALYDSSWHMNRFNDDVAFHDDDPFEPRPIRTNDTKQIQFTNPECGLGNYCCPLMPGQPSIQFKKQQDDDLLLKCQESQIDDCNK